MGSITVRHLLSLGSRMANSRKLSSTKFIIGVIGFLSVLYLFSGSTQNYIFVTPKEYTYLSGTYSGFKQNLAEIKKPERPEAWEKGYSALEVPSFQEEPVSPLEIIPDYDLLIKSQKDKNWKPTKGGFYKLFSELDDETKCKFYFRNMYNMDASWFNDIEDLVFDGRSMNDGLKNKLLTRFNVLDFDSNTTNYINRRFSVNVALQRMRIFEKCFMHRVSSSSFYNEPYITTNQITISIGDIFLPDDDVAESEKLQLLQSTFEIIWGKNKGTGKNFRAGFNPNSYQDYDQWDLEGRIFPFLAKYNAETFIDLIPKIRRNEQLIKTGHLPDMSSEFSSEVLPYTYDQTLSFWDNWQRMSTIVAKRGIVLAVTEETLPWALKYIATLRYQQNKLPIAIVHYGDILSETAMEKMIYAARANLKTFMGDSLNTYLEQELIFIDISSTLSLKYQKKFDSTTLKWLSAIFNLFEEFVIVDADTISYVDYNYYFETVQYTDSGSLFFREKHLDKKIEGSCLTGLESLTPRFDEAKFFDIFPLTPREYVYQQCENFLSIEDALFRRYFKDRNPFQIDSGLIVINKNQHVLPLIIGSVIRLADNVLKCNYETKELFWLGFLFAGHKYRVNEITPAAVGNFTGTGRAKGEICSVQRGHVSYENQLLWINGGGNRCLIEGATVQEKNVKGVEEVAAIENEFEKTPYAFDYAIIADDTVDAWFQRDKSCGERQWCAKYSRDLKEYSYKLREHLGILVEFEDAEKEYISSSNKAWTDFDTHKAPSIPLVDII